MRDVTDAYIEYGADTARTIFTLIFGGVAQKYPDINWIFSHGGGSLTALYERFTVQALMTPPYRGRFTRDDVERHFRRFYYDTAAVPNEVALSALAKMVLFRRLFMAPIFHTGPRPITPRAFQRSSRAMISELSTGRMHCG